jgi:opacity protein-like surface antigen
MRRMICLQTDNQGKRMTVIECDVTKVTAICVFALSVIWSPAASHAADFGRAADGIVVAHGEPLEATPVNANNYYVRADMGLPDYGSASFSQADLADNGGTFLSEKIGDRPVFAIGVGRNLSQWLRMDLTGEYRLSANVRARDDLSGIVVDSGGDILQANTDYRGRLTSVVGLANIYVDLSSWRGLTPYVGAGIGLARNELSDVRTSTIGTLSDPTTGDVFTERSSATSRDHSEWNFAWALMAGFSFDMSATTKLDLGYRYINLGGGTSASSNLLECVCGAIGQALKIDDIDAHEFRIGLRFVLDRPMHADRPPPLK